MRIWMESSLWKRFNDSVGGRLPPSRIDAPNILNLDSDSGSEFVWLMSNSGEGAFDFNHKSSVRLMLLLCTCLLNMSEFPNKALYPVSHISFLTSQFCRNFFKETTLKTCLGWALMIWIRFDTHDLSLCCLAPATGIQYLSELWWSKMSRSERWGSIFCRF